MTCPSEKQSSDSVTDMFYTTRFIVTAPYRAWLYICRVAEKEQEDAMAHQSQGDELAQSAAAETWPNYN
jgi:hypothetical protein